MKSRIPPVVIQGLAVLALSAMLFRAGSKFLQTLAPVLVSMAVFLCLPLLFAGLAGWALSRWIAGRRGVPQQPFGTGRHAVAWLSGFSVSFAIWGLIACGWGDLEIFSPVGLVLGSVVLGLLFQHLIGILKQWKCYPDRTPAISLVTWVVLWQAAVAATVIALVPSLVSLGRLPLWGVIGVEWLYVLAAVCCVFLLALVRRVLRSRLAGRRRARQRLLIIVLLIATTANIALPSILSATAVNRSANLLLHIVAVDSIRQNRDRFRAQYWAKRWDPSIFQWKSRYGEVTGAVLSLLLVAAWYGWRSAAGFPRYIWPRAWGRSRRRWAGMLACASRSAIVGAGVCALIAITFLSTRILLAWDSATSTTTATTRVCETINGHES